MIAISLIDIDECDENIDGCEQQCLNANGSFACDCRDGYRIDTNGRACNGIL